MMSFKGHEGLGQVAAGSQASHVAAGAPLPWWAGPQLLYGESAPLSPEETRRDGQFQVVPGAQGGTPDPAPPAATKRGNPEVLKFSVFQGEFFFLLAKFMDLLGNFSFSLRKRMKCKILACCCWICAC